MCYLGCMILSWMEPFQTVFWRLGLNLGARALSFALWKLGLAGGLAWSIGFGARVLITEEAWERMGHQMMPTGADSGNSSSGWTALLGSTGQEPSVVPSGGSPSGGWTRFDEDVLLEGGSSNPPAAGTSPRSPTPPLDWADQFMASGSETSTAQKKASSHGTTGAIKAVGKSISERSQIRGVEITYTLGSPEPGDEANSIPMQGAPEASTGTSSTLSGSRVERWLYPDPEVSSSVQNLDQEEQPQGGEAPNLPMGVMGPEAPDPMWLKNHIGKVFFQIKGRGERAPETF